MSTGDSGFVPKRVLPRQALKGDLHTIVTGKIEEGSTSIRIYVCEQSGDGTPGNAAAWTLYQLGAKQQQ